MGARLKRLASLVGLSGGSLLVAVLAIEVALRLVAPTSFVPQWERDLVLGWRGRPYLRGVIRSKACTTQFVHNIDGFRDRDRTVAKKHGVTRVLCTGDSFTWGWGVPQDAVYTCVLEELANGGDSPVEVVNAGVGGYNTVQSLTYMITSGFSYSPDIVIHQATGNDLPANCHSAHEGAWQHPYAVLDEEGHAVIKGTPIRPLTGLGRLKYQLPRVSRLAYVVRERLERHRIWLARRRVESRPGHKPERELGADNAFRVFTALARRMDEECRARGVRFVLLVDFPLGPERSAYWESECGGIETHFVHRYLSEREGEEGEPALIAGDGHWTQAAHTWIAEYLFSEVLRGG